jgi:hypothetical protein
MFVGLKQMMLLLIGQNLSFLPEQIRETFRSNTQKFF